MFTVEVHNYTLHRAHTYYAVHHAHTYTYTHMHTTHKHSYTHTSHPHNTCTHMQTHAYTCTLMHTQTQMHTHTHTCTHTNTYLYTSFRCSVWFFGCAASCGSRRKMVYSCTPWLTYKSGIKDNRSRISSCSCEIMPQALPLFSIQQATKG